MKKSFSVLLALFVLLSSLSFSMNAHYCGQQLVDIALFGDAEACSMALEKGCEFEKMPCCSDRNIIIDNEDYLSTKDLSKQEFNKKKVLIISLNYPIESLVSKEIYVETIENYVPPLIEKEIPILLQSFLL